MADSEKNYDTNNITICVDYGEKDDFAGRIVFVPGAAPMDFANSVEMLKYLQVFFENNAKQKLSFSMRTFLKNKPQRAIDVTLQQSSDEPEKGKKATFTLKVDYMQNSTWQGTLTWREKDKTVSFRSALEMIMLINEVSV